MAKSQYTHDAVATIGEYTNRQTGEKKKQFMNVGKGFTDDSGRISIKMNAIPVGPEWSGWISLYPAKEREQAYQRTEVATRPRNAVPGMPAAPPPAPVNHDEDDIPF